MEQIVLNGDNLEVLKKYPDNYFDAVVTDPPYGLGKEPDAVDLMKDWVDHGYHEIKGAGFMGKEWDAFVPQPLFWKEVFRVLKHGGHVVSFFGTRTYDWGVMAMRFAGFEVRDCIQWLYGSGFPKSHNISKAIDKIYGAEREVIKEGYAYGISKGQAEAGYRPADYVSKQLSNEAITEYAKLWDGWGSALKPANEPIVLARKPLEKGLSIAENVLKWGTGGINIDGCRVGFNEYDKGEYITKRVGYKDGFEHKQLNGKDDTSVYKLDYNEGQETKIFDNKGRFPANIILTHHPECECKGVKKVKGYKGGDGSLYDSTSWKNSSTHGVRMTSFADENGEETVEAWECHEDCPIKILDEQSGTLNKQGVSKSDNKSGWQNQYVGGNEVKAVERKLYLDTGGASRFFYCAKASKSERNKGLENFDEKQTVGGGGGIGNYLEDVNSASGKYGSEKAPSKNFHPTVKPVKLMQYLARLITPPNGKVLDPFCGSGTTGIACKLEGFEFVGIEQDPDYTKIAQARITNWTEEKETSKQKNKESDKTESAITQTKLF